MKLRIAPGYTTAAFGLAGTGALALWPDQAFIGWGLILGGVMVFVFGVRLDGAHLSARLPWPWWPKVGEYIPLLEAGQWLYDNGAPWLREHLKDPAPFKSITEYAAALVGSAADEGVGRLVASREVGLRPEPVKFSELGPSPFEAVFGADRQFPVNPAFRKADLPKVLEFYKNPFAPEPPMVVKRDTSLREGLMFFATGTWGKDPWEDGTNQTGALNSALEEFRQGAADGALSVWGKTSLHDVWRPIDRSTKPI